MKYIFLFLFAVCSLITSLAQEPEKVAVYDIKANTLFYPHVYERYHFDYGVGISFSKIPFDWVETAVQAPLFNFHANFGLPCGFSLAGDVTTLFVSNQIRVGPRWNVERGRFSANAGYDLAFMFGNMHFAGFDDDITAFYSYPNLSLGYDFGNMALTLEGDVFFINRMRTTAGSGQTQTGFQHGYIFTGVTVGIYLEQRITTNHTFTIAFRNNYTKYFYPAWMAFPTFDTYYYLPELYLNFKL